MADLTITYTDIEQAKGFADSALSSYVADVGVITLTARMAIMNADIFGAPSVALAAQQAGAAVSTMGASLVEAIGALSTSLASILTGWQDADAALARTAAP